MKNNKTASAGASADTTDKAAATTSLDVQPDAVTSEHVTDEEGGGASGAATGDAPPSAQSELSPPAHPPADSSDAGRTSLQPDSGGAASEQPRPPAPPSHDAPPSPPAERPVRVVVLVDHLGPRGFRRGDITSDSKLVKMLGDGSGRVGLVGAEFAE